MEDKDSKIKDHRVTEVGRCLCPCSKQSHPQPAAQDHTQFLNISNDGDFSGQSMPVLHHLHSKKVFPLFRGNSLCFSVCPLLQCCHSWLPHLCVLPSVFVHIDGIPPSLLFSRMKNPSSLSLSSQVRWLSPSSSCHFAGLSSVAPFPSHPGEPRTGHSTTDVMKITM